MKGYDSGSLMMDFDTWSSGILIALRELGDLEHQRRVWGKTTNPGDCFLEACERLYDNYDLPGFEVTHLPRLENHLAIVAEFAALRRELEPIDPNQPQQSIIDSPRWPFALEHAKRAHALLAASVTLALRTPSLDETVGGETPRR